MSDEKAWRLGRILAHGGFCSRRGADIFIRENKVTYLGKPVVDLNLYLTPEQARQGLAINGVPLQIQQQRRVFLLNKPQGYVCTHRAQKGQKSIFSLLPADLNRFFYAGRLDSDSCGLLVLSNDGDFIFDLSHPSKRIDKVYRVKVSRPLTEAEITKTLAGVFDKNEKLFFDKVICIRPAEYQISLHQGRNREIRRVFKKFNIDVIFLERLHLGPYSLDDLASGEYREIFQTI